MLAGIGSALKSRWKITAIAFLITALASVLYAYRSEIVDAARAAADRDYAISELRDMQSRLEKLREQHRRDGERVYDLLEREQSIHRDFDDVGCSDHERLRELARRWGEDRDDGNRDGDAAEDDDEGMRDPRSGARD